MSQPEIPEELVTFIAAIAEDENLRAWLIHLRELPVETRHTELAEMAEKMRANEEDPATILAVSALTEPDLFDAACLTVEEMPAM